jgi:hypothetical protein
MHAPTPDGDYRNPMSPPAHPLMARSPPLNPPAFGALNSPTRSAPSSATDLSDPFADLPAQAASPQPPSRHASVDDASSLASPSSPASPSPIHISVDLGADSPPGSPPATPLGDAEEELSEAELRSLYEEEELERFLHTFASVGLARCLSRGPC